LSDLYRRSAAGATRDDVHSLIASGALYVDLYNEPLTEPDKAHAFLSKEMSKACQSVAEERLQKRSHYIDFTAGSSLTWDGKAWTVANAGDTRISLIGEDHSFSEINICVFETLVKKGRITGNGTSESHSEIARMLASASEHDLKIANDHFDLVHRHLGNKLSASELGVPERTLRFWTAQYRQAKEKYGCGYVGLLPHTSRQ
jgi:putative transposase